MSIISSLRRTNAHGFTIVELLIVVVIIAILAAITIVTYNGVQARAQDAKTRSGVEQFTKALYMYATMYGSAALAKGNSGSTVAISGVVCADGTSSGFVGSGVYVCTTEDMLKAAGFLPNGFVAALPPNTGNIWSSANTAIMLYPCGGSSYALFWSLRQPSASDTANYNSIIAQCGFGSNLYNDYGMRAATIVRP